MTSFRFGDMKTCAECKSKFFVTDSDAWVYKKSYRGKRLVFCTYGCMRKWENSVPKKKKRKKAVIK